MKKRSTLLAAVVLLLANTIQAHDDDHHHHHKHGGHHHSHECASGDQHKSSQMYKVTIAGQEYKLAFTSDSTIKVNNDKAYPLQRINRRTYLVNWPDKNAMLLSNVIDWRGMKVYTTKLSGDKKDVTIVSDLAAEEVAAPKEEKPAITPAKQN